MSCLGVGGLCVKARICCIGVVVVESRDTIEVIASDLIKGRCPLAKIGLVCRLGNGLGGRRGWWLIIITEKGV